MAHAVADHPEPIRAALAKLEALTGCRLGDPCAPLLLSVRPSGPAGSGAIAPAILNLGITAQVLPGLARGLGQRAAADLYRRLIQSYGTGALGVEDEAFEYALYDLMKEAGIESEEAFLSANLADLAARSLALIQSEGIGAFPQDARMQLAGALEALSEAWATPRARRRRLAKGQPENAPLSLIVQAMVLGLGAPPAGAGLFHLRDEASGARAPGGRYLADAQGEEALMGLRTPVMITRAEREAAGLREPSLEELLPAAVDCLIACAELLEARLGEAFTLDFTIAAGEVHILELRPARRSARAALHLAVDLAEAGAISRDEALMRVDPSLIEDHLHPSISPDARRDPIGQGLPASPGAASGELVFSADEAEHAAASGRTVILALVETSPEDIRGMHAAGGVVTVRGGMTSHAAVVARSLGRPCVAGTKDLALDRASGTLTAAGNRQFRAGDVVTVDGGTGQILAGRVEMIPPEITGAFATLMSWADEARRMGVRANADTVQDANVALGFAAEGIGLCRTEHMFFQGGRITAMRRMILASETKTRRAALDELLPMQRSDFIELFEAMAGKPVVIRLLDPPLHEFLPHGEEEMKDLAATLDVPVSQVRLRAGELAEFNPMLGKRGCRIGIAYPEIYQMQARAIFEAACEAGAHTGSPVRPEIMLPLISAVRELVLLKAHISEVAEIVRAERGEMVDYHIGVMIETPRAALRGADIAVESDFLSFGTNDLTQMVYGLSRDDAGRFIPDYVAQNVYEHDPFHSLDLEGVGEIISIAAERARSAAPAISIGLCGEHGADPLSVAFCEQTGLDYISCSPFRVPVARLAAAQATIRTAGRRAKSGHKAGS